jgi:predicted ATPase/class 3 adenylate cyclase
MDKKFTFLFTDIEGSTRLWEQQPEVMSVLLTEHNQLLEQAIVSRNGKVFKTVGDGFCAVFNSGSEALAAAVTAQNALHQTQSQKNTQSVRLKVRMGLHSGTAEERDGDYFGPTLNRVARLMATASGGQILVSSAVKECVGELLPQKIELRDLGKHKLRDLKQAEHIFQVVSPDLPNRFPPIKSLSPRPTNLPAQLTSFVGRELEVDEVCRLLRMSYVRLLTLLGPGGIGKTRLSIQVGESLQDEYEDGIFFVALAPISHPQSVIEAIAGALKVEETGESTLLEVVKTYLRDRHLLLILDNFEQVIDAAPLVNDLLASAQHLKVLTTSREELIVYGEHVYTVSPLQLPEKTQFLNVETLLEFSAIAMFVERVRSVQPDFMVDTTNASDVIEICQRLDGLPLAIELAAVRIRDLSVKMIAEQLVSRLQVLSKGPRDFSPRQRTMRGAIEWSYDLLSAEEQQAFARLSIFVGPFTPDAAYAVTGVQNLTRLKEKSLIHQIQEEEQPVTFLMLETLREYALEQLNARSELEMLQCYHVDYYLQLTEIAEPNLTGQKQIEWFNRLEKENHNIQAALERLSNWKDYERAGRMVAVLWRAWSAHSRLSLGSHWLEHVLKYPQALSKHVYAKVTHGAGRLLFLQHRYSKAAAYLKHSLLLYEQTDDRQGQAAVYLSLGEIDLRQTNTLQAERHFQNSLVLYLALDDQAGMARCLNQLGRLALREGNLPGAETLFQRSLELLREWGSTESTAMVMNDLAEVLRAQGKYTDAAVLYHESLALYRQLGFEVGVAVILHNLGQVTRQSGDYPEALRLFREAFNLLQELEEKQPLIECLTGIGGVFLYMDDTERAVRFFSAANALMNATCIQLDFADQTEYESNMDLTRRRLDETTWEALWLDGQSMQLEQIFADVLHSIST